MLILRVLMRLPLAGLLLWGWAAPSPLSAGESLTQIEQQRELTEVFDALDTLSLMVEQRTKR